MNRQEPGGGPMDEAIARRLEAMREDGILERIHERDHTVWKDDPTEISDRLGWLTVAEQMKERLPELEAFAKRAEADGFEAALILGMGGSSLAPEMFASIFGGGLRILDTTHPATIAGVEAELDLDRTLFVVASKSGTTIETRSHLAHLWELTGERARSFVAITDPGTPLEELARERDLREVFLNPPDIGGRYSALSLFGLVPGALAGAPLADLLDGPDELDPQEAMRLGATLGEAALAGRDKLTLVLPNAIASLGDWIEQLVAESTGKEGTGIVPVVGEPLAPPELYGGDRLFVAYGEHEGLDAVEAAGHPVVRLPDDAPLGRELFRWELATAVAGHVLGINPFDQPNVASAKAATSAILERGGDDPGFDELSLLWHEVRPGDYLAITAFLDPTPEIREALQRARLALRDRLSMATTLGFGPRYLHSTGQLHKGGPNSGVFIQVVDADRPQDLPIPGEPFTFGQLLDAQALGDLRSLREAGRRVARVTLESLLAEVT